MIETSTTQVADKPPASPKQYPYKNLWEDLPDNSLIKTSMVLSGEIGAFLRSKHPRHGHFQTAVSILLQKFYDSYREVYPGNDYDPAEFEKALSECRIIIGGGANGTSAAPTSSCGDSVPSQNPPVTKKGKRK